MKTKEIIIRGVYTGGVTLVALILAWWIAIPGILLGFFIFRNYGEGVVALIIIETILGATSLGMYIMSLAGLGMYTLFLVLRREPLLEERLLASL